MKLLLALVGVTFCFLGEHSRYLLVSLNDTDDVGESDVTGNEDRIYHIIIITRGIQIKCNLKYITLCLR